MQKTIRQMVHGKSGVRGMVVATPVLGADGQTVVGSVVGWSYTHRLDKFDKAKAVLVASKRAEAKFSNATIPHDIQRMSSQFVSRAAKYFRVPVANVLVVGNVAQANAVTENAA